MKFLAALAGMLGLVGAEASAADELEPLVLEPSSQWLADYGDDSCSLRRMFGTGDQQVRLELQSYETRIGFDLVLAGRPFAKRKAEYPVKIAFGPDDFGTFENTANVAETWAGTPVLFAGAVTISPKWFNPAPILIAPSNPPNRPKPVVKLPIKPVDPEAASWQPPSQAAIEDGEKRATVLSVRQAGQTNVTLKTGSMAAPLRILRHCTDTLARSWGIDPEVQKNLTVRPEPENYPGDWVTSSDYPTSMLRNGESAFLRFVVLVKADGKIEGCRVVSGSGDKTFSETTCELLRRRARFTPARDAKGQAVKAYYSGRVRWISGG
jgi:Gram-negative bacterial TonB protein C-terminal